MVSNLPLKKVDAGLWITQRLQVQAAFSGPMPAVDEHARVSSCINL